MKKVLFLILFTFLTIKLNARPMGMELMIWPDSTSNDCLNTLFPSGLNWLFDRVSEFGQNSEYKQLEKLFDIDLEMFNHTNFAYDEVEGFPLDNWIMIDSMISKLNELKTSINEQPLFYHEIKYDYEYNTEEEWRDKLMAFNKKMEELRQKVQLGEMTQNQFDSAYSDEFPRELEYPITNDYLESDEFSNDIDNLLKTLMCYKEGGAQKVNIQYG